MSALKTLPIAYTGELHNVRMVCFSVPKQEVIPHLPNGIRPVIENDRVLFSLVSVDLKHMKAKVLPIPFNYHHVAIRLCVEDEKHNDSAQNQGVYFYQSYTDKILMVAGGKMLTNYQLDTAQIKITDPVWDIQTEETFIRFAIDTNTPKIGPPNLKDKVQRLDRAYFTSQNKVFRTRITRSEWPIKWADCYAFETNLFRDVRIEGAFYIDHPIHYRWNKPERIFPMD